MAAPDFYNIIQQPSVAEFKDRGSRFLAYAYPVKDAADFKTKLQALKKEHPKAAHHCFAYRMGTDGNNFRVSDDGEPSGSAGKPVLGQLDSKGVVDTAVIVVRYFGGTLLGVPGLINAYKTATALALQLTPIVQKPVMIRYRLVFDHTLMNEIMLILKQYHCAIEQQDISMFCTLQAGIPKARQEEVLFKLNDIRNLEIQPL